MLLDNLKNMKKVVGIKQSTKAVEAGSVKIVIIAEDADENIVVDLKKLCEQNSIEVIYFENMNLLGKACGIDVGASVVCILK